MSSSLKFDEKSAVYNLDGKFKDGIPFHKLQRNAKYDNLPPAVLVECGSFSPITTLHMQLFETNRDYLMLGNPQLNIIGGIISPVHDLYGKKSLVDQEHRVRMCDLATRDSPWIAVSDWEAAQTGWTRTRLVLDHMADTLSQAVPDVRVLLIMGSDVLESFLVPDLWDMEDLETILTHHGLVVAEREGVDLDKLIDGCFLRNFKSHIHIVPMRVKNNVSSTLVRNQLAAGGSVKWLTPDAVAEYIYANGLYGANNLLQSEPLFK
jgi:nicotinamide mononucleotide adenylyltransferase